MTAAPAAIVAPARAPVVPRLGRVVVVVFENKERDAITASRAPTFAALAQSGAVLAGYHGVRHPSLPNYLALVSGATHGITSDCTHCHVAATNLADTIERSGRTWKAYAEGYPDAPRYAKKHVPFLYFDDVAQRPSRLARIVPLTQLAVDLRHGGLPDFSLVVPDLCDDMHDCPVETGDRWLRAFLPPVLRAIGPRGVVFVIFDEGRTSIAGGGETAAFAVGPAIRPGSRSAGTTSHYGLLRTIEDGWRLPRLGASATAPPLRGIWRKG